MVGAPSSSALRALGRHRRWTAWVAPALVTALLAGCGFAEPAISPLTPETLNRIEIPPMTGLTMTSDIMGVDQTNHRLYVTDTTDPVNGSLDIFDISTVPGKFVKQIKFSNAHALGLAVADDVHKLFTGNDDSSVSVIDINPASSTYETIVASIPTNGQAAADLVEYDPKDRKVFVTNPDDGFITDINANTNAVQGRISNVGTTEQPRYDAANGKLYALGLDANSVITIDPLHDKLLGSAPIPVPCQPHGLGINPKINQGIIGCGDRDLPYAVAWDFAADKMIRSFDQAGAGDQVIYDPKVNEFFFGCSNYFPAEVAVFSSSPLNFVTAVPTSHHSKNVAYDETHDVIFTFDGRLHEAGLWYFPDPLQRHA